jgi:putative methionine-R-sulfoxide reductase with GAF domain
MKSFEYPVIGGITGHVFETGDSVVVNDVLQDGRYRSIKGWQAGSEMCVAIRDGMKVLGIIDVESSSRNSFTHNDFMALESLAGILASVITSADQYQRLQTHRRPQKTGCSRLQSLPRSARWRQVSHTS